MTETRHPDEPRLRKAIADFLAFRSVTTTTGPSKADFEVGTGTDAYRFVYEAYLFGANSPPISDSHSTHFMGRFLAYDEIWLSIECFLRANIDQPFLIWRKEPELYSERGYLKAYMRFATTDNPEHFLEAGRQRHAQEEQRFADASRQMRDSKHLAYRPGHGLDLPRLNGQQNGTVEMYPTPRPGETVSVTYEPKTPATLVDCPDCHQPQNPPRPLASGSGTANTPENENASPEPPQPIHYHVTERTGVAGVSERTEQIPCSLCDWGHPAAPVMDMRGMLRRNRTDFPFTEMGYREGSFYSKTVPAMETSVRDMGGVEARAALIALLNPNSPMLAAGFAAIPGTASGDVNPLAYLGTLQDCIRAMLAAHLAPAPAPDFEPDLDTEALFQAGRPIL